MKRRMSKHGAEMFVMNMLRDNLTDIMPRLTAVRGRTTEFKVGEIKVIVPNKMLQEEIWEGK